MKVSKEELLNRIRKLEDNTGGAYDYTDRSGSKWLKLTGNIGEIIEIILEHLNIKLEYQDNFKLTKLKDK